jgi:hypothetical protein
MRRAAAASGFSGILRLLREHAFLRYSDAGRQEYDRRLSSANQLFTNLVASATGLALPVPAGYVDLNGISDGTFTSLVRTVRRVVVRLRRKPSGCSAEKSRELEKMYMIWEKASVLLAALPE